MPTTTYPVLFEPALLSDSNSGIYTVPNTTNMVLRGLILKITNFTAATRLVTIYASTSGSESTTTAVVYNHSVPPYDFITVEIPRLGKSGVVEGYCDQANSCNVSPYLDSGRLYVP